MRFYSYSPEETKEIARKLSRKLKPADIIALIGQLGAGKTVFVQGILAGLKIQRRTFSPSFLLCRRLKSGKKIFYHLDLYRNKFDEVFNREIYQNIIQEKAIAAVEWAQKSRFWLKHATVKVVLKHLPKNYSCSARQITIYGRNCF